jgi:hypothetical protein
MSIYTPVIQGIYTLAKPNTDFTNSQYWTSKDIIDPKNASTTFGTGINTEVSGIAAYLNITFNQFPNGASGLQIVLQEQDPTSLIYVNITQTTVNVSNNAMVRLKLKQAIQTIAANTTQVQVQDTLPALWRIGVVNPDNVLCRASFGIVLYN